MKNLLKKFFCVPIRLYQRFISPLFPSCCRFTPTCSQYAIEAIEEHGVFVGMFLSFKRILRCNPYSRGGRDPVPLKIIRHHLQK